MSLFSHLDSRIAALEAKFVDLVKSNDELTQAVRALVYERQASAGPGLPDECCWGTCKPEFGRSR